MVWRHKHNLKESDYYMSENFPAEIEQRRSFFTWSFLLPKRWVREQI